MVSPTQQAAYAICEVVEAHAICEVAIVQKLWSFLLNVHCFVLMETGSIVFKYGILPYSDGKIRADDCW